MALYCVAIGDKCNLALDVTLALTSRALAGGNAAVGPPTTGKACGVEGNAAPLV
jgi:hypothetical protein